MVEPTSAAVSGFAKAIATQAGKRIAAGGTRLGSRGERRSVYGRFTAAAVEAVSFAQYLRIEAMIAPKVEVTRRVPRDIAQRAHVLQTELLQAWMEVRLVANPGPLEAGKGVLAPLADLMTMGAAAAEVFDKQLELVAERVHDFNDSCRQDLWYLPQRWQVYRPAWWRAAWSRRRGARSTLPPAED